MAGATTGTSQPARKLVLILGCIIATCVIVTTLTHYGWPELTGVPYHPVSISNLVIGDITVFFLAIAAFYHGRKTMGTEKSAFFLVSSILFAGIEETAWILSGRFGLVAPTYYFTYGGLWFFEIPVYTCLAWYLICYCGYSMIKQLFPRMKAAGIATLVAAFGTCWDLWLDPTVCNRHLVSALPDMWIWLSPGGIRLFGIPVLNFAGWFGVIFTIILVFETKLRTTEHLTTRNVGKYYLFLAIGWGILFAALHIVGALQYFSIIDILHISWGTPVDPVAAGTAAIAMILLLAIFALLTIGVAYLVILLWKHRVEQVMQITPAVLIGWWVIAGVGMLSDLLVVFPRSTLLWLVLACSVYPLAIIMVSLLPRRVNQANKVEVKS